MNLYLNDFISSVTTRQRVRIQELMREAKVSKETLPTIAKRLSELERQAPFFLSNLAQDARLDASVLDTNFRSAKLRVQELYDISNLISLLLDSTDSILLSEAKALEDDLASLEKAANNYAFLLADAGSYNYAYLETFSDELGRDNSLEVIGDRGALTFGPAEKAAVNTSDGMLTLPNNQVLSYGVYSYLVGGNVVAHLSARNEDPRPLSTTWRSTIDVRSPLTSGIAEAEGAIGAQLLFEYKLTSTAPASQIKVTPFADSPMELIQVLIYGKDPNSNPTKILDSPILLDRPRTINFPMQSVSKFRLVYSQGAYDRVSNMSSAEDEYRKVYQAYQERVRLIAEQTASNRTDNFVHLLVMALRNIRASQGQVQGRVGKHPLVTLEKMGGVSIPQLVEMLRRSYTPTVPYDNRQRLPSRFDYVLLSMLKQRDELYNTLVSREVEKYQDYIQKKGLYDPTGVTSPLEKIFAQNLHYRYAMGVRDVSIGVETVGFKGFFVSNPLDSLGDIGEIKIKTSEVNVRKIGHGLDNSLVTSVEYSVSNRSNPELETDWLPILPANTEIVDGERLLPDSTGKALFRFSADIDGSIFLYRNGKLVSVPSSSLVYDDKKQGILGMRLPVGSYSDSDILTASYFPAKDYTVVSFEDAGFTDAPLVAAFDSDGAGEGFTSVAGRNQISLAHMPFIDQSKVDESTYSSFSGTTPYQPIVVKFGDGTFGVNLTNYKNTNDQSPLPNAGYYYIHSGQVLIFSQPPDRPFRVYYQYLQNNVRFRVVLRCNSNDFASPQVDFVHAKGKTRSSQLKGLR